jgi:hypothetical protein
VAAEVGDEELVRIADDHMLDPPASIDHQPDLAA